MLLHAIGNSKLFAQVGEFLQKYHERDLDEALQEMSRCVNTRIPIFLTACVHRIVAYTPFASRLLRGFPVSTKIIYKVDKATFKAMF